MGNKNKALKRRRREERKADLAEVKRPRYENTATTTAGCGDDAEDDSMDGPQEELVTKYTKQQVAEAIGEGSLWTEVQPSLLDTTLNALIRVFGGSHARMTPVQDAAVPLFCSKKDVAAQACTGSGKTLAFLVPVLEIIQRRETPLRPHQIGAIVILPTRELAMQVHEEAQRLLEHIPKLRLRLFIGGSPVEADVSAYEKQGGNIIVATPGRLEDIMTRLGREFQTKELEVLILDEADRLLELGFQTQLTTVIKALPKQRRTGLFSATMSSEVKELCRAGLRNPVKVQVSVAQKDDSGKLVQRHATPATLDNYYLVCSNEARLSHFLSFLEHQYDENDAIRQHYGGFKCIVFMLTCACVDYFQALLSRLPFFQEKAPLFALHGKMVHKKRLAAYNDFVKAQSGVLLCTDVAARGLDLPDVGWIIQYDAPQDPSMYVHRIGRTARMGRCGGALLYVAPSEDSYLEFLQMRKTPISEFTGLAVDSVPSVLPKLRRYVLKDRDLHEKGQKAFVSYYRGYKEHQLQYIFRFSFLDHASIASGFVLLKLPKMPELKGKNLDFKEEDSKVVEELKFKDKQREKQRQENLLKRKDEADMKDKKRIPQKSEAWDKQKKRKEKKQQRKEKKQNFASASFETGNSSEDQDDAEELAREVRLMKKLKQGKITQKEFDKQMGEDSSDGGEAEDYNDGGMDSGSEDGDGSAEDVDSDRDIGGDDMGVSSGHDSSDSEDSSSSSEGRKPNQKKPNGPPKTKYEKLFHRIRDKKRAKRLARQRARQ